MNVVVDEAISARHEGRYAEALRILQTLFERIDSGALPRTPAHFITMFEWGLLVEQYLPAHEALARERDEQVRRLREGERIFGDRHEPWPWSRFHAIVEMNEILKDHRSTYEVFVQLKASLPALARQEAFLALPAIVEIGDFALAEAYLGNPLRHLDQLNRLAIDLPLYPPRGAAPRLVAELSNFMKEVILLMAVLRGQGRENEAELLTNSALTGLATDDMRELSFREIAAPGTIIREITSRQFGDEDADLDHPTASD